MLFWQTFASNGNVQAGTLSSGETSLIWKVIHSLCFSGLCSWFLHISPHPNASISRGFSLEKNLQFRDLSLFRLLPTYQSKTCIHWKWWICFETFVEDSVCLQNPFWTFPTETPSACLFFFKEREEWWRKELKQSGAFLQLLLYPPKKNPTRWEQWPLKMWVEYEPSV